MVPRKRPLNNLKGNAENEPLDIHKKRNRLPSPSPSSLSLSPKSKPSRYSNYYYLDSLFESGSAYGSYSSSSYSISKRAEIFSSIYRHLYSFKVTCRLPIQFDRRITHLEWLCQAKHFPSSPSPSSSHASSYASHREFIFNFNNPHYYNDSDQWNDDRGDYFIGVASKSGDLLLYHPKLYETDSFPGADYLSIDRRSTTFITPPPSTVSSRRGIERRDQRNDSGNSSTSGFRRERQQQDLSASNESSSSQTRSSFTIPNHPMIRGYGAGHSIAQFKFGPFSNSNKSLPTSSIFSFNQDPILVYSATISGFLQVHDLLGYTPNAYGNCDHTMMEAGNTTEDIRRLQPKILLRTDDAHHHWFTSLTINPFLNILVVGSTKGEIYWTDLRQPHGSGSSSYSNWSIPRSHRFGFSWLNLHRSKIQDLSFDPFNPYILASSSNDRHVCLWDWRYMKVKDSPSKWTTQTQDPSTAVHDMTGSFAYTYETRGATFFDRDELDNDEDGIMVYNRSENDEDQDEDIVFDHSVRQSSRKRHSCFESEYYMPMRSSKFSWNGLGAVPLSILPHSAVITSVEWNPQCPGKLLTTAQNSECRVYDIYDNKTLFSSKGDNPHFIRPILCVQHPHRQFQHLTTIRAAWSPTIPDIFLIARYPDPYLPKKLTLTTEKKEDKSFNNFMESSSPKIINDEDQPNHFYFNRKTIDLYSSLTGKLLFQFYDPSAPGIHSIVKFHPNGDMLASSSGSQLYFWSSSFMTNTYFIEGDDESWFDSKPDDDDNDKRDDHESDNDGRHHLNRKSRFFFEPSKNKENKKFVASISSSFEKNGSKGNKSKRKVS